MTDAPYDLLVIGSGPGGYIGAIRAAQLGLKVACVERDTNLGGTCLRIGCIPSKALLESTHLYHEAKSSFDQHGINVGQLNIDIAKMHQRKTNVVQSLTQGIAGLFKKHQITRLTGHARLLGATQEGLHRVEVTADKKPTEVLAKKILLATGSKEASLKGVTLDGSWVGSSTEALAYEQVPEHLVVIGAGAIGLELGSVWSRLGAKVTVLEYAPRILPAMDVELAQAAQRIFAKQGLEFRFGTKVLQAKKDGKNCVVEIENDKPIKCSRVLVAVGRIPNTDALGLENVSIALDARGCIPVDKHFATSAPGIYAIGDVITGPMLAHKAEEEAVACVEHMVTGYGHVDYNQIAYVVYTMPEIASVGQTEEQLKQAGVPYRKGSFPWLASARARAMAQTAGFVKLLAHKDTDRLLGAHILGLHAGDLIGELAVSMAFGASSEDIARVSHPHPTLCEAIKEAALAVDGRPLNL